MRPRERFRAKTSLAAILAATVLSTPAPTQAQAQARNGPETGRPTTAPAEPVDAIDLLLERIEELGATVDALRTALADSMLDSADRQRELDELRQFIDDHYEFGRDFAQYQAIKSATRSDAQGRRLEEARQQRAARQTKRTARQHEFLARRAKREAELRRVQGYTRAGFTPLGFDVYMSKAAFNYQTLDGPAARYDWNGLTGHFIRLYPHGPRIDFSSMMVSGSVMSASEQVRDIGIALTFFDEAGTQVGSEIIQVNNARPEVPYPFTTTVAMALDRPFASTTTYVLYADPSDPAAVPGDAGNPQGGAAH